MKLTHLPKNDHGEPEPYVALSYVWGMQNSVGHETNVSNIMRRKERFSIKLMDLPLTIQDTIQLVRGLGVRYIWIDSLCISQGSLMSWRLNAESMHLIFGNAYFTICAADGDSNTGLQAIKARNPKTRDAPMRARIKLDLDVITSRSPESIIEASKWIERGWTFQEHLLSPRCLVFAGGRLFFQCRTSNCDDAGIQWFSDWSQSPLRTLRDLKERPVWFYTTCVELYTGRNLTRPEDILRAFNGVSRLIEDHMHAPFFFGLPSSHFDFALLWRPKSGKERRPAKADEDAEFPSWSWSGWQQPKKPQVGTCVKYPPDMLKGGVDLHDWLLNHTWIVWYIRDKNGNLEPLWQGDKTYTEGTRGVAERWRGYMGGWDSHIDEPKNDVSAYGQRFHHLSSKFEIRRTEFERTLPNNPFGVRISRKRNAPYQPLLQFWTWKRKFYIYQNNENPEPGHDLVRLDVLDENRDWCGTVVIDKQWAAEKLNDPLRGPLCEFIALSDARKFAANECITDSWNRYIPKDLEDLDWDLYHVMLIEYKYDRLVWERKGLGKVMKAAFEPLDESRWAEVTLG
ncbi:HET-domain-containing protein [Stipitochalara longipes BDJ]|nr:HET-domain-containing protein [Stipitochalara longipes BDJ]